MSLWGVSRAARVKVKSDIRNRLVINLSCDIPVVLNLNYFAPNFYSSLREKITNVAAGAITLPGGPRVAHPHLLCSPVRYRVASTSVSVRIKFCNRYLHDKVSSLNNFVSTRCTLSLNDHVAPTQGLKFLWAFSWAAYLSVWYICKLQLGWQPVEVVQYTFTHTTIHRTIQWNRLHRTYITIRIHKHNNKNRT